jgi:hypothetical protein
MGLDAEALAELDELSLDDGLSNVGDTAPIHSQTTFASPPPPSSTLDSPIDNGVSVAMSASELKEDQSTPIKAEEHKLESPPSALRPQFLTYPSTPAVNVHLDSAKAFNSLEKQPNHGSQDSTTNLMEETRLEMQALRELNERLVRVNEEYKDALGMCRCF